MEPAAAGSEVHHLRQVRHSEGSPVHSLQENSASELKHNSNADFEAQRSRFQVLSNAFVAVVESEASHILQELK